MKKFISTVQKNIFYVSLIVGMIALVGIVAIFAKKREDDKTSKMMRDDTGVSEKTTDEEFGAYDFGDEDTMGETSRDRRSYIAETEQSKAVQSAVSKNTQEATGKTENDSEYVLNYDGSESLMWPLRGNIVREFSMDTTVYYETLNEYKVSPEMLIEGNEDDKIIACYRGKITDVGSDPVIGNYITIDLGGGFLVTYGSLKDITAHLGEAVQAGDVVATLSTPTKYNTEEGTALYLKITKDGTPVDPLSLIN